MENVVLSVTDFVALCNQTLEFAYPRVTIEGEISGFRVSKNKWVYFDIKDEMSSLRCFGTVYVLPGPLEDGMLVNVGGTPRLHPQYGFSVTMSTIQPVGDGALRRAYDLLKAKLTSEGLFDEARKRSLPFPPKSIALVTSKDSAAYHDFMKILDARFGGIDITHIDVHVQGVQAPGDLITAIKRANELPEPPDVVVITRGGGSPDDLAAFDNDQVVRSVAGSRVPTLVAIGHEVDVSLAELAADARASTPSNAAELIVPDKRSIIERLASTRQHADRSLSDTIAALRYELANVAETSTRAVDNILTGLDYALQSRKSLAAALDPAAALRRGYAVLRSTQGQTIKSVKSVNVGDQVLAQLHDGTIQATVDRLM